MATTEKNLRNEKNKILPICPNCSGNGFIALDPKKKDLHKSAENFISCPMCTLEGARTADSGPVSVNLY